MQKKNILEKIVKKDYNNELEEILEQKQYKENVKSTLLSILYKIEAAYKDLEIVKRDVENKEEYIANILNIIKNNCNSIQIIKMQDTQNKIPSKKTYVIDKEKGEILAYPIERKILYAISKIGKKEKIIKDEYYLVNETISNLINVGNNINMVEPLRDFNGYSWTTISQEIESIDHNLIYQNLRVLIGNDFLNKWVKNSEFLIDYFDMFKEKIQDIYGTKNQEILIDILSKISILLEIKFDKEKEKKLTKEKEIVEEKLKTIENKDEFLENITKEKIKISDEIKRIDTTINNKKLLEEEYNIRNEKLPIDKKIFSMRVLSKIMQEEREEYFKKIEQLNEIMNPQKFLQYKKELENKGKYLKLLDIEDKNKEIDKLKKQLQKIFLQMMKIKIKETKNKSEIEKIIYDLRYYELLPYDYENKNKDIEGLKNDIEEIEKMVIDKAIELKVINKISDNKNTNYEILKNIFTIRIINLNDSYLKITKGKIKNEEKYFLQIFDENVFEEKLEISKPKELEVKLNKKIAIWC